MRQNRRRRGRGLRYCSVGGWKSWMTSPSTLPEDLHIMTDVVPVCAAFSKEAFGTQVVVRAYQTSSTRVLGWYGLYAGVTSE